MITIYYASIGKFAFDSVGSVVVCQGNTDAKQTISEEIKLYAMLLTNGNTALHGVIPKDNCKSSHMTI